MCNFVYIICPVYNAQDYISSTIESVLNQTYRNWKLICVDDCSTDASVARILAYQNREERIELLRCAINSGPAHARNIGIKHAIAHGAEYLAFIDSDDQYEPIFLEKMLNASRDTNADVVWCNILSYRLSNEENTVIISHRKGTHLFLASDNVLSFFYENIGGLGSMVNKLYRVSFIKQLAHLLDEERVRAEDWEFNLRLFQLNPSIYTIEDLLYNYIHHDRPSVMTTFRRIDYRFYWESHRTLEQLIHDRNLKVDEKCFREQFVYFIIAHFQQMMRATGCRDKAMFEEIYSDKALLGKLHNIVDNSFLTIKQKIIAYCIKFRLSLILKVTKHFLS